MAQLLQCDSCHLLIQDGTERIDVALPTRRDTLSGEVVPGAGFNFHLDCFQQAGPLVPGPGVTVSVRRVEAVVVTVPDPAPAPPVLPDPLRAPAY